MSAVSKGMRDASNAEDLTWIQESLQGSPAAFERIYEKYRDKVLQIAYRVVYDKEDALDICQEVFTRIYRSLGEFKTESRFFTWLYRVTANRSIDFLRRRKKRSHVEIQDYHGDSEVSAEMGRASNPGPLGHLERKELGSRIQEALQGLSDNHRNVFVMHAMCQLSYKEIAEALSCSIGTVMSRLFYARKNLQVLLKPYLEDEVPGDSR